MPWIVPLGKRAGRSPPYGLKNLQNDAILEDGDLTEALFLGTGLLAGSGANNPMIADLNSAISSIRSAILNSVENLISTLDLQLARIEGQEKEILSRMSSSSGQELQLLSIERQYGITSELYKYLLQKREENELAEGNEGKKRAEG